jgi:hypothetical protein
MSGTLTIFMKQIENFIEEISIIFPDITSIKVFRHQYDMLKMVNPRVLIENFIRYVYPHKTEIMSENEDFFLRGGGQEFLNGNESLTKFRDTMSEIWLQKLSEENKTICWKYFKVFILLSEKYIKETQMTLYNVRMLEGDL